MRRGCKAIQNENQIFIFKVYSMTIIIQKKNHMTMIIQNYGQEIFENRFSQMMCMHILFLCLAEPYMLQWRKAEKLRKI